jgi:hypothetical protein
VSTPPVTAVVRAASTMAMSSLPFRIWSRDGTRRPLGAATV